VPARLINIKYITTRAEKVASPVTALQPHHLFFCRLDALLDAQPTVSKHWRQNMQNWGEL